MIIEEIDNMNKQNKLNPKYSYYIEDLKDGFGVIHAIKQQTYLIKMRLYVVNALRNVKNY